ncbi:MAG: TetR/AcrR family transcriptional regulator [Balneola sp.]
MSKKDQIINIATKLFSERGYENTPLSMVCEEANVSKGLIAHHFKSKDGLLREIFTRTTQLIIKINTLDHKNLTPNTQLIELLESFFSQLQSDKLFFKFNMNVIVQPSTRELLDDLIKERSSLILNKTLEIFKKIDPDTALVKSHLFIAELDGITISYLGVYKDFPLNDIKEQLINKYSCE